MDLQTKTEHLHLYVKQLRVFTRKQVLLQYIITQRYVITLLLLFYCFHFVCVCVLGVHWLYVYFSLTDQQTAEDV